MDCRYELYVMLTVKCWCGRMDGHCRRSIHDGVPPIVGPYLLLFVTRIIDHILSSQEKVANGEQLRCLYNEAVRRLCPKPEMRELLEDVLGAMCVLQERLSVADFAR